MKETNIIFDVDLKILHQLIKNLTDEVRILKVQIENLQDRDVPWDELDSYYRCQCG